jgi:hypothetical protein
MFKVIIFAVVCFAIVNGNVKDDLKEKVTEALHQGEKVKVCEIIIRIVMSIIFSQ